MVVSRAASMVRPVLVVVARIFGNPAIDRAPRDTRRLLDYIGPLQGRRRAPQPPRKVAALVRREPTTYPRIAFGWPGLRRRGGSSPDSNPPHKGRESPNCRRTVLPKPVAIQIHLFPQAY